MADSDKPYSIVILCGGAGRRAGGADKPLLTVSGQPLVSRILASLGDNAPVLISANRNLAAYAEFGTVVEDQLPDFQGPLAGLCACLTRCVTPLAFVCPGDGPDVTPALVERLHNAIRNTSAMAVVAHDGTRRQNLYLMVRTEVQANLDAYLKSGARSVHGWLTGICADTVDCSDLSGNMRDVDTLLDLTQNQHG